jgi:DNA-binding transcriptional MerR regulator
MQIGELARRVGTTTDTVRFYERAGWLPRATRRDNAYREYSESEVEHLQLLLELRRLGLPLADAARVAGWCHLGHCDEATRALPALLSDRRAEIADRMESLRLLDEHLARLESHLAGSPRRLPVIAAAAPDGACCAAAAGVMGEAGCACCASSAVDPPGR